MNKHSHNIFLDEVQDLIEDFGLSEEEAKNIAHEWLKNQHKTTTNNADEFLNSLIGGCNHCIDKVVNPNEVF